MRAPVRQLRPGFATLAVGLAWRARGEQDARTLSYTSFFLGQHRCGGSLAGLLFPAPSIAPERLTEHAPAGQHSIAAAAFTAPVGALWIPLFALRPGNNIPPPAGARGDRPDQHGWPDGRGLAGRRRET